MDKKFAFQVIGLTILILGSLFYVYRGQSLLPRVATNPSTTESRVPAGNTIELTILDAASNPNLRLVKSKLNIELADTKEKRAKGLGGRDFLASDSGMLFIHDTSDRHKYWMKGMRIPLDFIWINEDRVVDILKNIKPPVEGQSDETIPLVAPIVPVNRVLEVNAGFTDSNNIRIGDKIEFTN